MPRAGDDVLVIDLAVADRSASMQAQVVESKELVAETKLNGGVYALAFSPDGQSIAAAGEDGHVRLVQAADGKVVKEFVPVPVTTTHAALATSRR